MKKVSTKTITVISLWTRRYHPKAPYRYDVKVPVARTIEDMLEEAYTVTNVVGRPQGAVVAATTSGDLLLVDGVHYLVAAVGFHRLTDEEAELELTTADSLDWSEWSLRNLSPAKQPGVPIHQTPYENCRSNKKIQ